MGQLESLRKSDIAQPTKKKKKKKHRKKKITFCFKPWLFSSDEIPMNFGVNKL
jgi:hypothetical protein